MHYTERKRKYFSLCIDRVLPRERLESCLLILADMQTLSMLEDLLRVPIHRSPPTIINNNSSSSSRFEVVSSEQNESTQERVEHEVAAENKPREISPEDRMGILFGDDPIEFLSVKAESTEQVSSEDLPSQVFTRRIPGTSKKRERGRRPSTHPLRKATMNLKHLDTGMTLVPLLGVTLGCLCRQAHRQNHGPREISPALGTDEAAVADPPRILGPFFGSWKEPPERSPSST